MHKRWKYTWKIRDSTMKITKIIKELLKIGEGKMNPQKPIACVCVGVQWKRNSLLQKQQRGSSAYELTYHEICRMHVKIISNHSWRAQKWLEQMKKEKSFVLAEGNSTL